MSALVSQLLSDVSRELGEGTVNSSQARIEFVADAVVALYIERKWNFAIKKDTSLTTSSALSYDITAITDIRQPGGIKEILIDEVNNGDPILPIDYDRRKDYQGSTKTFFYVDPEQQNIIFTKALPTGKTITIRYYHIPARKSASTDTYISLPQFARKAIGLLGASYVQYSRYLEAQGDKKFKLYTIELQKMGTMDRERKSGNPMNFGNYLQRIGFKRTYPR